MTTTIILINLTMYNWTPDDFLFINRWYTVCDKVYGSSIARIIKLDKNAYRVICR